MTEKTFKFILAAIAVVFVLFFCAIVVPPLTANPDISGAFAAGFVNPYASGYSMDVILCWVILLVWVIYDFKVLSVKHGWACVGLGIFPGVVVGLSLYLILRTNQISQTKKNTSL